MCAEHAKVESGLKEARELAASTAAACNIHEESLFVVSQERQELIMERNARLHSEDQRSAAIHDLATLSENLENVCLAWEKMAEDLQLQNGAYRIE